MDEKLKNRSIWLIQPILNPSFAESAAALLRDVKSVQGVRITGPNRLHVSYNIREITLQIIEALLLEFGYKLRTGFFCRFSCAQSATTSKTLNVILPGMIRLTVHGMHSSLVTCAARMAVAITVLNTCGAICET